MISATKRAQSLILTCTCWDKSKAKVFFISIIIHTFSLFTITSYFSAVVLRFAHTSYRHSQTILPHFVCICFLHMYRIFASKYGTYAKKQSCGLCRIVVSLVPVVGLEPTRMISPQDFESSASASFTTPARQFNISYSLNFSN